VGVAVHVLQSGLGDVGVDLSRREALVPEEFLDDPKVRAALDEVGGVGVAKGVGVNVTARHAVIEDPAHVARTEPTAPPVKKEGLARRIGAQNVVAGVLDPQAQRLESAPVQRH